MKKRIIITNNREIYEKFNMLNFSQEIILSNVKPIQVERIINNINRNENILTYEKLGNYFIIRKIGPLNASIYLKKDFGNGF